MTVVSMCQISFARVVRSPILGFAGCTEPGAAPAVLADEAMPGWGQGPHLAESLGENGERAGRDVDVTRAR